MLSATMAYSINEHIRTWTKTNKMEADDMCRVNQEIIEFDKENIVFCQCYRSYMRGFMLLLNLYQSSLKPIDDRFHNMVKLV